MMVPEQQWLHISIMYIIYIITIVLPVKCIDKLKMSNTQTILPLVLFWKIQHLLKLAILSYLTLMIDYLLLGKRRCVSDIFLNWDHTLYVSVVTNEGATFLETAQYDNASRS